MFLKLRYYREYRDISLHDISWGKIKIIAQPYTTANYTCTINN